MKFRIVPYKPGSSSAKLLARNLTPFVGHYVLSGRPRRRYINILWGKGISVPNSPQSHEAIAIARNKLSTFKVLEEDGINIPLFTTDRQVAEEWIEDGETVFARHTLTSCGGLGIDICQENPLPNAPLYVKYIKKKKEFRVHVLNEAAIDVQQKKHRRATDFNSMIRNHQNGWVFCRQDIIEPEGLRDIAIKAVNSVGLLFGAVDIIYNERQNKLYVLEINTAPGLTETTARKYAQSLSEYINEQG